MTTDADDSGRSRTFARGIGQPGDVTRGMYRVRDAVGGVRRLEPAPASDGPLVEFGGSQSR